MDSQFVNFDGRSVHDMIQTLLAASGDPEAIRRLQESINAVDQRAQSSISVLNAAIEQLDEDKQDAGDYVLNGGAPGYVTFKFSDGSYVMNMRRSQNQYSNGISIMGVNSEPDQAGILREWFRWERNSNTLQGYVFDGNDWSEASRWSADEDTGWRALQNILPSTITTGAVYARKKNGIVSIQFENVTIPNAVISNQDLGTLPSEYRPTKVLFIPIMYVIGTSTAPVSGWIEVGTNGNLRFRASANAENVRIYSYITYTV